MGLGQGVPTRHFPCLERLMHGSFSLIMTFRLRERRWSIELTVIVGDQKHLQKTENSSYQIQNDKCDAPPNSRLSSEVHVNLKNREEQII